MSFSRVGNLVLQMVSKERNEIPIQTKNTHAKTKQETQFDGLGDVMCWDVYHGNLFPSHSWESLPCKLRVT